MSTSRTPSTPGSKIERTPSSTPGGTKIKKDKILVTIRLRPLSKKEQSLKDQVAWECADEHTIVMNTPNQERSSSSAYTFDKVFGPTCPTDRVYEEGAKEVALSTVRGINATIFAYGQTSSGKTYTMRGIMENAVTDIYKHIQSNPGRKFFIRISALEIYNEVVRDLLNPNSGPLRLLDDPEKGTIVEKLEEETAKDSEHLSYLIGICEAQRQVGETALNDASSRSHQIIRLTIESSFHDDSGCVKSYVANLNFVDLAGSERTSQTNAEGVRLKEGCHINLSLLTLTTVIRKLSDGKRFGHIPYRQSKLTRILQLSLEGNARTAIICTMSPALSHVEQSRSTLSFASCAKEITNSAQVNVIISDKQLVKQLQREVARLEAELHGSDPSASSNTDVVLLEKEMQIKKMEIEMEKLKQERDVVKSQFDELQRKMEQEKLGLLPFESSPRRVAKCLTFSDQPRNPLRQSSTVPSMLVNEIRKLEQLQVLLGEEANKALEVLQKEVACHRLGNQDAAQTIAKLQAEIKEVRAVRSLTTEALVKPAVNNHKVATNLKEEITRLHSQGNTIANLEEQLENVQKSLDKLVMSLPNYNPSHKISPKPSKTTHKKRRMVPLTSNGNVNLPHLIRSPCSPLLSSSSRIAMESEIENMNPDESHLESLRAATSKSEDSEDASSREGTPGHQRSKSVNMKKMQKMFQNAAEENVRSIKAYVTELKERVAKLQYQKQLLVCQVLELESNENAGYDEASEADENLNELHKSPATWKSIFEEQMRQIIELWDICHVSLVHRTQFYLLFKGDQADQIYIEVELRRLNWMHEHFTAVGDPHSAHSGDELSLSLSSNMKALRQEREFLSKRMNSRLTEEERERLYTKWRVPLVGKQRKLQLVNKLWRDPKDKSHIEESADIVARLVGFCEGENVAKEMFELNFALPENKKPWLLGWQPISNFLGL
ncbi:kinesin-like protein KIN-7A isoform X1 [Phalaenopsis equestris]|uniref:kinesin-like protein KIN-7A isoform X1 n=1 Tax=Phalaenopsis equestris TaxID=78828 RepID=UPI0009E2B78F|nr:kinesin-like protein KIN-7A isoform X1 [Phalaenopsis equestris]XP_020597837.1 kinesin-like protein KIN-7A isoform X1 [Phalaenopsis equestris]